MTSKIISFGMSVDTRQGSTGLSGNAVLTVEQMVRMGWVSSLTAKTSPRLQELPVTVISSPSCLTFIVQPLGHVMQTMVCSVMLSPPQW